jgi:OmpR-family two-component system manganese-sensing response regulator
MLEQESYEVATSPSVRGAFELACSEKFELIMLDSWLNDGSGLDLCRKIRKLDELTPILFYSALAFEKDKQEAFSAGAHRYLVKPVNLSELFTTVAELIGNSRAAAAPLVRTVITRKDSGELLESVGV